MEYREQRVLPPLDRFVECVWFLTDARDAAPDPAFAAFRTPQRILPDGCIELIFHFRDRFLAISATGHATTQPACFVVGLLTMPFVVGPAADVDTMAVRFRPGGAYPFFRCSLSALTDRAVPLEDLWGAAAHGLWERLAAEPDKAVRIELVSRALVERMAGVQIDRVTAAAIDDLLKSAGRARIARVASRAGVTARHLQRRFADRVGVSPKVLARVLRFQRTLLQREAGDAERPDWVRVAVDCGYTDQSHLIHDYAAFAGETPASLVAAESELSTYFTAPQRLAAVFGARR
jgi:AraC-like DNA-binding protein